MKRDRTLMRWKVAFFILLAVVLFMLAMPVAAFFYLTAPVGLTDDPTADDDGNGHVSDGEAAYSSFTVTMDQASFNQLVEHYTREESSADTAVAYRLYVEDAVILSARMFVMNREIPVETVFSPEVLADGNLLLHYESMRISVVELPAELVWQTMQTALSGQEWMRFDSSARQIVLLMEHFTTDAGFHLYFKQFDLDRDMIELEVRMNE